MSGPEIDRLPSPAIGKSTGPRTREGKAAVAAAHLRHGRRAKDHTAMRRAQRDQVRALGLLARACGLIKD